MSSEDEEYHPAALPDSKDPEHWAAMFRGAVLASQKQTLITYVTIADQKAQVMLFLNSLIIPFIVQGVDHPNYHYASLAALATASLTVFFAVITVFPRGPARFKKRQYRSLLHFADIKQYPTLTSYLSDINPIYNSPGALGQETMKYIYDVSRYVLRGKYYWLRLCYGSFLIGNALALVIFILNFAEIF